VNEGAPEREHKPVTTLCCDLAGSTGLAERLGPDAMHAILERFFALALAEVHRHGGTVNQFLGDGLLALFDSARDGDYARRAVLAGLGLQRALAENADTFAAARGELRLRIGLSTGNVIVGSIGGDLRADYTAAGDVTTLATRLQGMAEPGWVYACEATYQRCRAAFGWEKVRSHRLWAPSQPAAYRTRAQGAAEGDAAAHTAVPASYTPAHLANKILTSRSALEGERKQITVLFCELADPRALAGRLGPDAMHRVLERFFQLALAEVHRYEGTVNQLLGDGLMALFGAPVAHEDHARRAVLAGLGIQRALHAHAGDFAFAGGEPELRIGLNTGVVVVGKIGDNLRMDYTAVGDVTNLASRIQRAAAPGWLHVSEATFRLTDTRFEWEPLGETRVKGRAQPVALYRTRAERQATEAAPGGSVARISSPFVGRDGEVAVLRSALERLAAGEGGGIVGITGEPGLGKSRLLLETRRLAEERGVRWLEGRALSLGQTLSYWPFIDMLRRWMGVGEEQAGAGAVAALRQRIEATFAAESDEMLAYLVVLLGLPMPSELEPRVKFLDGDAIGRQIFRSMRRLIEGLAKERPLALVLEDLHWADQSTTDLIEHLLPLAETAPLLVVWTSRPDPRTADAAYRNRCIEIPLKPLVPEATRDLVGHLLEGDGLAALRERVLARAEGNPFFAEEIVRSLAGSGDLARDAATGRWRATRAVDHIAIPDTLHGVIAARVDRLAEEPKLLLKIASVIGRRFLYRVLDTVAGAGQAIGRHLAGLEQLELIRERRRLPELEYWFTHALVQEATYDSILVDRRRHVHLQVADCIAALFAERIEEYAGILAHHYARAAEWARAQRYLLLAGDHAAGMAGNTEALAHYREAVEAYGRVFGDEWDPVDRAVLERKVGEALFRRGEHHAAIEHFSRALAGLGAPYPATRIGVQRAILGRFLHLFLRGFRPRPGQSEAAAVDRVIDERCRIYGLMGWMHFFIDQERSALDVLLLLDTAEGKGRATDVVKGSMGVGTAMDVLGLPGIGGRYHEAALAMAARIDHPIARADAHVGMAWHRAFAGDLRDGVEHALKAAGAYREAGDLRGWGASTGIALHLGRYRGDFAAMIRMGNEMLNVGEEGSDNHLVGWGNQGLAFALGCVGPIDEAVQRLRRALDIYDAMPAPASAAEASADLALCELRLGRVEEAVARLEKANRTLVEQSLRGYEAVFPRNALAQAYLVQAEGLSGAARARVLSKARRVCRAALAHGRKFQPGYPYATRVRGTYEWLAGRSAAAELWWKRSLEAAARMGTRHLQAQTHLEIGRRTGAREHLADAESIFRELGAKLDLADAQATSARR
jgi:class 3 adenylate cyclase/tetratricopeptide (TPR) repeat protein